MGQIRRVGRSVLRLDEYVVFEEWSGWLMMNSTHGRQRKWLSHRMCRVVFVCVMACTAVFFVQIRQVVAGGAGTSLAQPGGISAPGGASGPGTTFGDPVAIDTPVGMKSCDDNGVEQELYSRSWHGGLSPPDNQAVNKPTGNKCDPKKADTNLKPKPKPTAAATGGINPAAALGVGAAIGAAAAALNGGGDGATGTTGTTGTR